MPLVKITTQPRLHPRASSVHGTTLQKLTGEFAEALPALIVGKGKKLHLDPDTPETAVQVTHAKFHGRDVNTPDMWIVIQFSESGLSETQRTKVVARLKKMILNWFTDNGYAVPENYAVDIFWGPSHGFFNINGVASDW